MFIMAKRKWAAARQMAAESHENSQNIDTLMHMHDRKTLNPTIYLKFAKDNAKALSLWYTKDSQDKWLIPGMKLMTDLYLKARKTVTKN